MDEKKDTSQFGLAREDEFFRYDDSYPPLCIKPPSDQENDFKLAMEGAVTRYLQDSYKNGLKHEHAILDNGLSAGEAGMFYFRELYHKRRKIERVNIDIDKLILHIRGAMFTHMNIDVGQHEKFFRRHIHPKIFQNRQYKRTLTPAIKAFLKDINMKTKGYTSKLRNVMADINALVDSETQTSPS